MFIRENATLSVSNPVISDMSKPVTEALVSDLKIKEVRAIYPLVKAINSGRLTRNMTYYPAESLIGKNKIDNPTGYSSFVKPFGKPVLKEHQAQNMSGPFGSSENADVPMGRIVFAGFRRRQEKIDGPGTMPSKKHIPGTVEGDGSMYIVPAVTDPESITRVLGGAFQTVSIGSRVENVWESVSSKNIAELRRKGEELPPYERGQLYEGKLSFWRMGEIQGIELSFVNVPSDEYAGVVDPDIGTEGIRLLVAEKKAGKAKEFNFFDALTSEKVIIDLDDFVYDESFFVDSAKVGHDIWWLNKETKEADVTEAADVTPRGPGGPFGTAGNGSGDKVLYCCPDHTSLLSYDSIDCPYCGKKMEPVDDGDDDESSSSEEIMTETKKEKFKELIASFDGLHEWAGKLMDDMPTPQAPKEYDNLVNDLHEGNELKDYNISDIEAFTKLQDVATEYIGEWNQETASFAVSMYLENGGKLNVIPLVDEEDTELTLGSLYLLDESDENYNVEAKLSTKSRDALSDSSFCGPNRSFPVHDKAHAVAALRLLGRYKGGDKEKIRACIHKKAKKYGVGSGESDEIVLYPFIVESNDQNYVPLLTIRSVEELDNFIENISTFAECYGLTDELKDSFAENMSKAGDSFTELLPSSDNCVIEMGRENLVHYVLASETNDERIDLVTLVGLVRKGKLNKEDLKSAFEAYNVFGTSVLRKFLESVPEKPAADELPAEKTEAQVDLNKTETIDIIPNPMDEMEETKEEVKKESKSVWSGFRVIPAKRNGKHPIINKEN